MKQLALLVLILPFAVSCFAEALSKPDCSFRPPDYPLSARRASETGIVTIKVEVDEHGNFMNVSIAQSSGHMQLDTAALAAMRNSSCQPYYRDGHPISFSFTQKFSFDMD